MGMSSGWSRGGRPWRFCGSCSARSLHRSLTCEATGFCTPRTLKPGCLRCTSSFQWPASWCTGSILAVAQTDVPARCADACGARLGRQRRCRALLTGERERQQPCFAMIGSLCRMSQRTMTQGRSTQTQRQERGAAQHSRSHALTRSAVGPIAPCRARPRLPPTSAPSPRSWSVSAHRTRVSCLTRWQGGGEQCSCSAASCSCCLRWASWGGLST
mmetsp:Transcript_30520/g.99674  ORF Transcript_30520/g.99674 Transcript_30520/m.99674 type:complete len:215 (+) Transcript_30520:321-965(+)